MSNTDDLIARLREVRLHSDSDRFTLAEAADALTAQAAENEAMRERLDFHVAFTREAQDLCLVAQKQVAEQAAQSAIDRKNIDRLAEIINQQADELEALRADAERWRYAIASGQMARPDACQDCGRGREGGGVVSRADNHTGD